MIWTVKISFELLNPSCCEEDYPSIPKSTRLFVLRSVWYSPRMSSILIKKIGTLVTGKLESPLRRADSIFIKDGIVQAIGNGLNQAADQVIDANGITAIPGLIDSHSHPSIGEYTPAQNSLGWITNYMHGGVTALISAGELHLPGLPLPPDARTALSVAIVTKKCYDNLRPSGVKVHAGTLLLVPGLGEKDFDEIASLGIKLVKFIFYDYSLLPNGEAERYVRWAHARGIKVKIHSGGVSRSGVSQVAGWEIITALKPDIIGHITGGPIPMPEEEMIRIANETDCFMEICTSGNYRLALSLARAVKANGQLSSRTHWHGHARGDRVSCLGGYCARSRSYHPSAKWRRKNLFAWRPATSGAPMI